MTIAEEKKKDFEDWLESIVIVDNEGKSKTPELVEDEDQGEDAEEETND